MYLALSTTELAAFMLVLFIMGMLLVGFAGAVDLTESPSMLSFRLSCKPGSSLRGIGGGGGFSMASVGLAGFEVKKG